jgi:hypothetical protein
MASSHNQHRSTPGTLMIVWAALLGGLVLFAWRLSTHREDYTWHEWPTALGDHDYYKALSTNDFYQPALKLPGKSGGLFRRSGRAVSRDDVRMERHGRDAADQVNVYIDPRHPLRFYLRAGPGKFVEFGERRFWPDYQPPKAEPIAAPKS